MDGLKIHTEAWLPPQEPRAAIIIIHGYGEHIGRYAHVAQAFVNANYAVYGCDHRGHGQSEGLRAYFDNIEQPVEDLHQFVDSLKSKYPDLRFYLYGHSMGSLVALRFVLTYPHIMQALIVSGTPICADDSLSSIVQQALRFINRLAPKIPLIPALSAEAISTDSDTVNAYENDPLVYRGAWRPAMAALIVETGQQLRQQIHKLQLPLLILHGEEDQIAPVSGSLYLYANARSNEKTLFTYPQMRHEVHNEIRRETVIEMLLDWIGNN